MPSLWFHPSPESTLGWCPEHARTVDHYKMAPQSLSVLTTSFPFPLFTCGEQEQLFELNTPARSPRLRAYALPIHGLSWGG